jgi:hypothetical protein
VDVDVDKDMDTDTDTEMHIFLKKVDFRYQVVLILD